MAQNRFSTSQDSAREAKKEVLEQAVSLFEANGGLAHISTASDRDVLKLTVEFPRTTENDQFAQLAAAAHEMKV